MAEISMIEIGPVPKLGTHLKTNAWDNLRTQVLKIYISHGDKIYGIQFQYCENEAVVLGDIHGRFIGNTFNVVNLNYPLEYLTGIRGAYESRSSGPEILTTLAFQTNMRLHGPFGSRSSIYSHETKFCFDLGEERRHFGGFHGTLNPTNDISAIGIYVKPVMELLPVANSNDNNVENIGNVNVED